MTEEQSLPLLREELDVYEAEAVGDDTSAWTLHDPISNRFFRINASQFEMLSRWHLKFPSEILTSMNKETSYSVDADTLKEMLTFLAQNQLLKISGQADHERLMRIHASRKKNIFTNLLHHYLFFRIPLVNPNQWLSTALPYVQWLGSLWFRYLSISAFILGILLVSQQWERFLASFSFLASIEGILLTLALIAIVKIVHELGHAFTLKNHGCHVPSMGIAFMVLWPVLYTDATDAWRLKERHKRLHVGMAGIAVELGIAAWALLLWNFLPDGMLKSLTFMVCTTTIIMTLLVNLNPFMRFDGYYILSDTWRVPNLQEHSFGLAQWAMRNTLWGINAPKPHTFGESKDILLIVYAFGTWLYRFFLFLGIAFLVYQLFFKVLGLFLMLIEIIWFIVKPIVNELRVWWKIRQNISKKATLRTFSIGFALILLGFIPWHGSVVIPSVLRAKETTTLFIPMAAQLTHLYVKESDTVEKDQILAQFFSEQIDYEQQKAKISVRILEEQLSFWRLNPELRSQLPILLEKLQAEKSKLYATEKEAAKLILRASKEGCIATLQRNIHEGDWLSKDTPLLSIVSSSEHMAEAYSNEQDIDRIAEGNQGTFYPNDWTQPTYKIRVFKIHREAQEKIQELSLLSTYGGEIGVRVEKEGVFIPQLPVYKVLLSVEEGTSYTGIQYLSGRVVLDAKAESFFGRIGYLLLSELIRNSEF